MSSDTGQGAGAPRVRTLAPEVIERIAAGEVIERPASVARELIANALDADATDLRVEMREGGLRMLRVSDDGCGIAPDDLELATRPHTTSKARTLADLDHLTTLGFRGEALASIATVAELTLASACDESGLADAITLRDGVCVARERLPRGRGVTATARDLFHSMPARRALLRGPRFEASRVAAVTRAYALAHPAVRVTLISDGALLLQTPGADLAGAVAAIFGADVARSLLPLSAPHLDGLPDVTISGAVAARPFHFPTREHVYLSVNGRPLANRALHAALEAGYRPALRKGRHPLLVARVSVAPDRIDANIHPAKLEALLRDEVAIAVALRTLTHEALGAAPVELAGAGGRSLASGASGALPLRLTFPATRRRRGLRLREQPAGYASRLEALRWDADTPAAPLPELEPLAQFDGALIVAQSAEGHLYLVDQHRAHERILYERLLSHRPTHPDAAKSASPGQSLLEPLLIELTRGQAQTLTARLDELAELGLELQPFGGSAFLARSLPHAQGAAQSVAGFAQELAQDAAEEGEDWLDHVCIALACRSAVRRGQPLSAAEQRQLLVDLRAVSAPAICPHGSPLVVRHSRAALTRLFEW
ncbi:MAG TPA: DNA mismatch repair endonuclease MutL [Ktedonobacterales bacterium]|jgi:DNA mismatch repair protein MutL|nr:DNA mismatch repair endonuclease MutL [Ktedonobacterales bacterium]